MKIEKQNESVMLSTENYTGFLIEKPVLQAIVLDKHMLGLYYMPISFDTLTVGQEYTRPELADIWGYHGYQAISRGIVTPKDDNKIILFITHEKQSFMEQYEDSLVGNMLAIDVPAGHFAEDRMLQAADRGEEVHLFYRDRHHSPFRYCGQIDLVDSQIHLDRPSNFHYRLRE